MVPPAPLSTSSRSPSCARMIRFDMVRPRPVPSRLPVRKDSKMRSLKPSGIPLLIFHIDQGTPIYDLGIQLQIATLWHYLNRIEHQVE